ncbi:MAG: HEPN domain-containing protein [Kineosporiaceae bacterium]
MTGRDDARRHLDKAREFLTAAGLEYERELFTAAASSAVIAGINAKDAICLRLTGRTGKSDDHRAAVPELAAAGPAGKELESTFRRLLGLKTSAQYQAAPIGRTDATKALQWATRMVDTARDVTGA